MSSKIEMTATITAIAGKEALLKEAIRKCVDKTVLEAGCEEFKVFESKENEGRFILWEIFQDQEALIFHMNAQHTKEYFNCGFIESTQVEKLAMI